MLTKGSVSLFTLLVVLSLQELQLLAAPGIENAAYTSQDLLGEAAAPAQWVEKAAPAPELLRRLRRYGYDYEDGGHCQRNHHGGHNRHHGGHHGGHHRHHHQPYGHGYGHGQPGNFGPGFNPWQGPGFPPHEGQPRHNEGELPFGTPLAPFKEIDRDVESGEDFNNFPVNLSTTTQATKPTSPTNPITPTAQPVTTTTTEDPTLNIDIRIGT